MNMKRKYKLAVKNSYNNARLIADYICIALMRYDYGCPKLTYVASIKLCKWRHILDSSTYDELHKITDNTISWYTIKIYTIEGSRNSLISPISNKFFGKIIISDELLNTLEHLKQTD